MKLLRHSLTVLLAMLSVDLLAFQQRSAVTIDEDDITIRGCVTQASPQSATAPAMLVWSRSDIMLAGATAVGETTVAPAAEAGIAGRVFYWLEDDENISKHVGRMVVIKGKLRDFEKGEIEVKRDGAFTDITLELGGKEDKVRVPTSWLGPAKSEDHEFDIVARRIHPDDVDVVGACRGV
jgi:hypothetical protein